MVDLASRQRWSELLEGIAGLIPAGPASVLVDGAGDQPKILAGRLACALNAAGRPCFRLPLVGQPEELGDPCVPVSAITLAHGPDWRRARRWDVVVWLRTGHHANGPEGEARASVVVDLHDPRWPVIRRVAEPFADRGPWYVTETRAFFATRAATWDTKFGDDLPAYAAAIAQARIPAGGLVLDVGCGTGRALPALRRAVGPHGTVVAVDLTPEMLREARPRAQASRAGLVLADARVIPFADRRADAIFAAGLIMHLPDPVAGLGELARITRPAACSCCSIPRAARRWPPATAGRFGRTNRSPRERCGGRPAARGGGWPATTTPTTASSRSPLAGRRPLAGRATFTTRSAP